ncbi:MAG: malate synthase A, partial [Myxococcota bacterium]
MTEEIVTPGAVQFVTELQQVFGDRLRALHRHRFQRRQALHRGEPLGLLHETRDVRASAWQVTSVPHALRIRQVELTAPPKPRMIARAMTSGADV